MSETQKVKRAEPIETCSYKSPCVRHCCLDDKDICIGCGRTLDEICHVVGVAQQIAKNKTY
nr:DUF1289 domain-containing protein [Vibrio metschnikovii]